MFDVQYICLQSWVPVRASNSSASEMVTSLLFGETCIAVGELDDWLQIRTNHDGYAGFIPKNYVCLLEKYTHIQWKIVTEPFTYMIHNQMVIQLSPGSRIPQNNKIMIDGNEYVWKNGLGDKTIVNLLEHAQWFLNTPYLWGGRSIFGIDCSGLIQVLGLMSNLKMPRDAFQQALCGARKTWSTRQAGDLCYFENISGKITHVGILISTERIIHASGKVRIDFINPEGIVNSQSNELTHKLADIRTW